MTARNMPFLRGRLPALLALLALTPLVLYAWMGTHSRLLWDDFCLIVEGQELGAWGRMLEIYNSWSGSYSVWFLGGLFAPLDAALPRLAPAVILLIWLAGAYWLLRQGLDALDAQLPRRSTALALAALLVTASIHAFDYGLSLFWMVSGLRYGLSAALLTGCLALALHAARRFQRDYVSTLRVTAVGAGFFVCGGFAEILVVFQLALLSLSAVAVTVLLRERARSAALVVLGAAWLGSFVSLLAQYFAPGTSARDAYIAGGHSTVRALQPLVMDTLRGVFAYMARPELVLSLLWLMAVGALAALCAIRARRQESAPGRAVCFQLPRLSFWALLALQWLWLPLLWAHTSDDLQVFGRFSWRYLAVILLNIGGILAFGAALWQRSRLNAWLQSRSAGAQPGALTACALFVMMNLAAPLPIDRLAAAYLFSSVGGFLLCVLQGAGLRLGWLALAAWASAWLCVSAMAAVSLFGMGGTMLHAMPAGFSLVVASGLSWGLCLGCAIAGHAAASGDQRWVPRAMALALGVALLIGGVVVARQTTMLAEYRVFAAQWDANHNHILDLRAAGEKHIVIEPPAHTPRKPLDRCTAAYYGVESVTLREE